MDALRDLCARKAAGLGQGGVRGHAVRFSVTTWDEPPSLPDGVSRTGCVTRGDVLDIGQQVRAEARPAADLLTASFIWGWGTAATARAACAASAPGPGTGWSSPSGGSWTL